MIKAREFYSGVWVKDDDKHKIYCESCKKEFRAGDLLLDTESIEEFPYEESIIEYCPHCEKIITE